MAETSLSLWWDQLPLSEREVNRPPLEGEHHTDVAIIGAGYTGLWTAYWLTQLDPHLDITIIDAETVGFGASGRNGGWCSALFPVSLSKIAAKSGREAAIAMHKAMQEYVGFIGETLRHENIECDWQHGGDIYLARTHVQERRAREELKEWREWGFTEDDHRWLSAAEAQSVLNASAIRGATFTPHCARIHPAKLVRGLAHVVEQRGVRIYEATRAHTIEQHRVSGTHFEINARFVVRATEGYTAQLPEMKRTVVPVYSLMVSTEPLSDSTIDDIGLKNGELFADYRHLIIYGQRTADNRIAFGGRGAPYHFGSGISPHFDQHAGVHRAIEEVLTDLLPQLRNTSFTHHWGGPLAISRDWYPSVHFDETSGLASAGGYVGDGVATSALAGHTLAELITGQDTERTRLPWVNHKSPQWPVEPFRWLSANVGLRVMTLADTEEHLTRQPSQLARAFNALSGR